MRVAVEHAVAVHRALSEPEEHLRGALLRLRVGSRLELGPGQTVRPFGDEHSLRRQLGHDLRDANEGMTAVPAPERLLVRGLDAVVELVVHASPQLVDQRLDVEPLQRERGEQVVEHLGVVEIGSDRAIDARVLHLDRDLATIGQDGSVHLADGGCRHRDRVPVEEEAAGLVAELAADDPLRERRRHGRHVGLQRGERSLRFGGKAFGDEADQLARLHDGALHVPQLTGDVLGGADREPLLEGRSRLLVGSRTAHLHHGVVGAAPSREPPHPRRSVEAIAAVSVGEGDPTGDCGRDQPTSEGCRGQPSRHRARRSQLAQVAQRTANGAACNRSSPIGPPQTSHVS